jgi:hypothetical protein
VAEQLSRSGTGTGRSQPNEPGNRERDERHDVVGPVDGQHQVRLPQEATAAVVSPAARPRASATTKVPMHSFVPTCALLAWAPPGDLRQTIARTTSQSASRKHKNSAQPSSLAPAMLAAAVSACRPGPRQFDIVGAAPGSSSICYPKRRGEGRLGRDKRPAPISSAISAGSRNIGSHRSAPGHARDCARSRSAIARDLGEERERMAGHAVESPANGSGPSHGQQEPRWCRGVFAASHRTLARCIILGGQGPDRRGLIAEWSGTRL